MIRLRPSAERGHARHGWLESWHTFSFADYFDPAHKGFRSLRVINEDIVQPGQGFPMHPHRDMEIITWILDGELEHTDSMGNGSVIRPGEAQLMRAGTGVTHSEFNPSETDPVHLLQIWIFPETNGLAPAYDQKAFDLDGRLCPLVTPDGRDGSLVIRQDASLLAAKLGSGAAVHHTLAAGRHAWVQVTAGALSLNGVEMRAGDGAAVSDEGHLEMASTAGSQVLVFDIA